MGQLVSRGGVTEPVMDVYNVQRILKAQMAQHMNEYTILLEMCKGMQDTTRFDETMHAALTHATIIGRCETQLAACGRDVNAHGDRVMYRLDVNGRGI